MKHRYDIKGMARELLVQQSPGSNIQSQLRVAIGGYLAAEFHARPLGTSRLLQRVQERAITTPDIEQPGLLI
jgi:hypothetical protein